MCKYPEVNVKLVGEDGNAFSIMGRASAAAKKDLKNSEYSREEIAAIIKEYTTEAMSGDYDHLLSTTMNYFNCDGMDDEDYEEYYDDDDMDSFTPEDEYDEED